jgi:hypothetical protein
MTARASVALLLGSCIALAAPAAAQDLDGERQAWRFRRAVTIPEEGPGLSPFAALTLPPEVAARCQADLRDVRLVDREGRERPFVVDRIVTRGQDEVWPGRLVDARRDEKRSSVWVVDLGESRIFHRIELDVPGQDFAKGMAVEASDDQATWRVLRADAGIFDRLFGTRIHHTRIDLASPASARFIRLTTQDRRSPPVEVRGARVVRLARPLGSEWSRPVAAERLPGPPGRSRYRLDLEPGLPLEGFDLDAEDAAFHRLVRLLEVTERKEELPLGEAWLYRVRAPGEEISAEALSLRVQRPQGALILEIQDGDSPPLRGVRGVARGAATRLLFPVVDGAPLTFYYGNGATRAPVYDLELLKERLSAAVVRLAELGPEAGNPRFQAAPPLAFVPTAGAGLDVTRWRALRTLAVPGREDLYAVTLGAEDLGVLRPDLGDLRLVDASDRQVPYVLFPDGGEERVALEVMKEEAASEGRAVTRYVLATPPAVGEKRAPLPLRGLELDLAEGFFDRPARLFVPVAGGGRRRSDEVLFAGRLSRAAGRREPVTIPLDGAYRGEMVLEIEEGDNAPLTLKAARGTLTVPRVALKARPGPLRLVLGNPEAGAPRYDIATLRREVVSYSAEPLRAGGLEPNPAFRRRAGDYLRDAPPTMLLWGALGVAVVALLFLTARLVRPEAGGPGP